MIRATILISLIAFSLSGTFLERSKFDPTDGVEFVQGWIQGSQLFGEVTPCPIADPQIAHDLTDIIDNLKSIHSAAEVIPAVEHIMADIHDLYTIFNTLIPTCEETAKEIKEVAERLVEYVKRAEYPEKFVFHLLQHLKDILARVNDLKEGWGERTQRENGRLVGELERFVLFWDFE